MGLHKIRLSPPRLRPLPRPRGGEYSGPAEGFHVGAGQTGSDSVMEDSLKF